MSMDETSRQLTERKNGQRSAAMDAQITAERQAPNGGPHTAEPSPLGTNAEVLALLNKTITRLDELSGRVAEIERHIAGQRPDAERFAHEIGPIVLATRGLRDEISKYKDEIKASLDSTKKEVTSILKQIEAQIGQHRKNIEKDIGQCNGLNAASQQMVQQGAGLLQQSMTVYTKSTQSIADVSQKAAKHVEATARKAGDILDEQTASLKKDYSELAAMFYRVRDWLVTKTIVIALVSAIVGSAMGGLIVVSYTMSRIDATAEVYRNSEKWKYIIEKQNKKNPQAGDEINRQIEQEMKTQEVQDENK